MSEKMVVLPVNGMTCNGCVNAVRLGLSDLEGVSGVQVTLQPGEATVTYDPAKLDVKRMVSEVSEVGYSVVEAGIREA